jgi:hypothetical protein
MSHQSLEIFIGDGTLTWIHLFRIEQVEVRVAKPTAKDVFELTGGKVDLPAMRRQAKPGLPQS